MAVCPNHPHDGARAPAPNYMWEPGTKDRGPRCFLLSLGVGCQLLIVGMLNSIDSRGLEDGVISIDHPIEGCPSDRLGPIYHIQ